MEPWGGLQTRPAQHIKTKQSPPVGLSMDRSNAGLSAEDTKSFLAGRSIYVFEPSTLERVACVDYGLDGVCTVQFVGGGADKGRWGLKGDGYWTQYDSFREGSRNTFFLRWVAPDTAQAYYEDGTPAFVQSGRQSMDGGG